MNTINGLPAHILLVHAIVVLVPLAAFLLILTAVWPAARRRLAGPNAILAVGALVMIPITTGAGEWLERHVARTALIERHTQLGDTAVWFSLPVTVLALVVWWRGRETDTAAAHPAAANAAVAGPGSSAPTVRTRRTFLAPASAALTIVIAVGSVAAAGSAVYDIYRIGDSGAQASWNGRVSAVSSGPER